MRFAWSLSVILLVTSTASAQETAGLVFPQHLAPVGREASIAVLPVHAEGLDANEIQRLGLLLRARVEQIAGVRVQPEETTRALVESAQSLGLGCDLTEAACAAEFGLLAAVDYVVIDQALRVKAADSGEVAEGAPPAESRIGIDLLLVEVAGAREVARATALLGSVLLPGGRDATRLALDPLVAALFAEEAGKAHLATLAASRVEPPEAEVLVNGARRGSAASAQAIEGLLPGAHAIEVRHDGFLPYRAIVEVKPGEAALLEASLAPRTEPLPTPPQPRSLAWTVLPWTLAGAGASFAVGGALAIAVGLVPLAQFAVAYTSLNSLDGGPASGPEAQLLHQQARTTHDAWGIWGAYAAGAGAAVALVGVTVAAGGAGWGLWMLSDDVGGGVSE